MDVESEDVGRAWRVAVGEPINIGDHQRIASGWIEGYRADWPGLPVFSADVCDGNGTAKVKIQSSSPRVMLCPEKKYVKGAARGREENLRKRLVWGFYRLGRGLEGEKARRSARTGPMAGASCLGTFPFAAEYTE